MGMVGGDGRESVGVIELVITKHEFTAAIVRTVLCRFEILRPSSQRKTLREAVIGPH